MGFKRPNQLCQSTKGLGFNPIRSSPTALTIIQQLCSMKQKHTKYTQINTNKSTHSEMDPVWQNPIQRTVRTAHLSVHMTVHNISTQYNTVLITSPLTSRQTSCCLSQDRGLCCVTWVSITIIIIIIFIFIRSRGTTVITRKRATTINTVLLL